MRDIAVVTSARSDFGIYLPILKAIRAHPDLSLKIVATGMHLSPKFGMTVQHIEEAGFHVDERVDSLLASGSPEGIGKSIGLGVIGFAQLFMRYRPDILFILGDRFDMYPAPVAALPFRIPTAHLHGGEITVGVIDDALRHSLTKLSHMHFASTEVYAQRIVQMGEEPWRVTVCGAPALDNLRQMSLCPKEDIAERYNIRLDAPSALVTFHPVTLESEYNDDYVANMLVELDTAGLQCVFTYPNADMGYHQVIELIDDFCRERPHCTLVKNTGQRDYFSIMNTVSVMVGNSSSGIIEAASFKLPVVNIGTRQEGRVRAGNVIDCGYEVNEISAALRRATNSAFYDSLTDLHNPYGDGYAADLIVERLSNIPLGNELMVKRFYPTPSHGEVVEV